MNNKIVYDLFHMFARRGFSVLRFNFRGVGRSQGELRSRPGRAARRRRRARLDAAAQPQQQQLLGRRLLVRRLDRHAAPDAPPGDPWASSASRLPANMYDFSFLAPCPSSGPDRAWRQRRRGARRSRWRSWCRSCSQQRGIKIDSRCVAGRRPLLQRPPRRARTRSVEPISTSACKPASADGTARWRPLEPDRHEPACAPSSSAHAGGARLHPPGTDLEALDALAAGERRRRLCRLRLHRRQPARRQSRQHHDAALAAAHRPPADRAGRRRHDQGRRPVGQGREPPAARRGADRRQQARASSARSRGSSTSATAGRRCWSTTPSGWTSCATSRSCATSGAHFTINRMLTFEFGASCGSSASSR